MEALIRSVCRKHPRPTSGSSRAKHELAFYSSEDLTPSDFYRKGDADEARDAARLVVELVRPHVLGEASD